MKRDNQNEADGETIPKHRDFRIAHRRPLPDPPASKRNLRSRATILSTGPYAAALQPTLKGHLDKRRGARQGRTMGFGPFRVKAKFGEQRIATSAAAMAFVRSLEPPLRTSYHWKVAERMIHFAWMSAEDEALAERAFMIALETDALLIP